MTINAAFGGRTHRGTEVVPALPHDAAVARASERLRRGGLVALPTETVYGLAADARSDAAVAAVYAAKGRPAGNPVIVHVDSVAGACDIADLPPSVAALAALWPGPLTMVLPVRSAAGIASAALAGGDTVAVRVPDNALFRAVIARVGPLVAPSANRSGRLSPTTAAAVLEELGGRIDLVIDGGACLIGIESTVVEFLDRPRILRPGAGIERIEAILGAMARDAGPRTRARATSLHPLRPVAQTAAVPEDRIAPGRSNVGGRRAGSLQHAPLRSPGLLASHYAPRARLRLDVAAADVAPAEGWLALGSEPGAAAPERTVRLSPTSELTEAARNLYAGLRALDATGVAVIAVSPIPAGGLGDAIRDRLARAAAPRPFPPAPGWDAACDASRS